MGMANSILRSGLGKGCKRLKRSERQNEGYQEKEMRTRRVFAELRDGIGWFSSQRLRGISRFDNGAALQPPLK